LAPISDPQIRKEIPIVKIAFERSIMNSPVAALRMPVSAPACRGVFEMMVKKIRTVS
jgi:hypothetical protein